MMMRSITQRPETLLVLMAVGASLSFATWMTLIDNFSIHRANFSGKEIGVLQSLREVPGFLAFAVIFLIMLLREQRLAYLSLALLGLGTAVTGFFPSALGLYLTTVLMSIGFHYYETLQNSLTMQWVEKDRTPEVFGRLLAAGSAASVFAFALIWLVFDQFNVGFSAVYAMSGCATALIAVIAWRMFPDFPQRTQQHKHLVVKRRYLLYYALVFMSGARRQIFVVFAGFLLVEKFGYGVQQIASLFLLNALINIWLAPIVGRWIGRAGERVALILEYLGLVVIFCAYAFVESAVAAAALYLIDHVLFSLSIAITTYFQKIADPADIASTAGVAFSINHIAAVVLPVFFGIVWIISPPAVFLAGALMAAISLCLSFYVPRAHDLRTMTSLNG